MRADSSVKRFVIDAYHAFKRRNPHIARNRESLENILIPFRLEEHRELFRRNGFTIDKAFSQFYKFNGILCVKRVDSARREPAS